MATHGLSPVPARVRGTPDFGQSLISGPEDPDALAFLEHAIRSPLTSYHARFQQMPRTASFQCLSGDLHHYEAPPEATHAIVLDPRVIQYGPGCYEDGGHGWFTNLAVPQSSSCVQSISVVPRRGSSQPPLGRLKAACWPGGVEHVGVVAQAATDCSGSAPRAQTTREKNVYTPGSAYGVARARSKGIGSSLESAKENEAPPQPRAQQDAASGADLKEKQPDTPQVSTRTVAEHPDVDACKAETSIGSEQARALRRQVARVLQSQECHDQEMVELSRVVRDIKECQSAIADSQREIMESQQHTEEKMDTLRQSIFAEVRKMLEQTANTASETAPRTPVVRQVSAGAAEVTRPSVFRQVSAGARMVRRIPSGEQLHVAHVLPAPATPGYSVTPNAAASPAAGSTRCAAPAASKRVGSPRATPASSYRLQVMTPDSPLLLRRALHTAGLGHPASAVLPRSVATVSAGSGSPSSLITATAVPAFPAAPIATVPPGVRPSVFTVRGSRSRATVVPPTHSTAVGAAVRVSSPGATAVVVGTTAATSAGVCRPACCDQGPSVTTARIGGSQTPRCAASPAVCAASDSISFDTSPVVLTALRQVL